MSDSFWAWLFIVLAFVFAVGTSVHSCPRPDVARDILEAEGFSAVHITGGAGLWSCSKGDGSATGFRATGPTGARVRGVVCCGLVLKACTVRIEGVEGRR